MPTTNTYYDTETTYELKTFAQTLACGKCGQGELLPIDLVTDSGATIHACASCGQTQAVEGEVYPRTFTKNVLAYTDRVERTEEIADKEPDDYTAWDIGQLTTQRQADLLFTTRNPAIVDIIEQQSEYRLHQLQPIRETLYNMAREAANLRAATLPVDEADQAITGVTIPSSIVDMARVLNGTQREEVVEMITQQTERRLPRLPEIRKALYDCARAVITLRAAAEGEV